MIILCKCGNEFNSYKNQNDDELFICPDCTFDHGPAITDALLSGRVVVTPGLGVANLADIKKLTLDGKNVNG